MRVAFAGTPAFAARALEALAAAGHEIVLVLTQPDRPAGRGLRIAPSAVALAAARLAVPLSKPASLRDADALAGLRAARPEVLVVAAYGSILPQAALDTPARGCLNIHASLLPRWRGAAPVQRAILAGDARTGITIMRMDAGLDTGDVLLMREAPIDARDTAGTLTDRLAGLGAEAIVEALERLDSLVPAPQDPRMATYAAKVRKEEARLDWADDCVALDRRVRAFNPAPGAQARIAGEELKVWEATPVPEAQGAPGELVASPESDLLVGCGRGALRLAVVQRPGGRKMAAAEYRRGISMPTGSRADTAGNPSR